MDALLLIIYCNISYFESRWSGMELLNDDEIYNESMGMVVHFIVVGDDVLQRTSGEALESSSTILES